MRCITTFIFGRFTKTLVACSAPLHPNRIAGKLSGLLCRKDLGPFAHPQGNPMTIIGGGGGGGSRGSERAEANPGGNRLRTTLGGWGASGWGCAAANPRAFWSLKCFSFFLSGKRKPIQCRGESEKSGG